VPHLLVTLVEWDENNEPHATARASREQIEDILYGEIDAKENDGTADYRVTGAASDGSTWLVVFDFDGDGKARPVTAWAA
jgi:hypothetical protein